MAESQWKFPAFDTDTDYFNEYIDLTFQNEQLRSEYNSLLQEVQELWSKTQKWEKRAFGARHRRKNAELKKFFECPRGECKKTYAYKSSLLMHLKRKHPLPFGESRGTVS